MPRRIGDPASLPEIRRRIRAREEQLRQEAVVIRLTERSVDEKISYLITQIELLNQRVAKLEALTFPSASG